MSLDAMRWAWSVSTKPPTAKYLLLALANCCNSKRGRGDTCWASLTNLTQMTGLSRASVCRLLDDLERHGLIQRERSPGQKVTVYQLMMMNGQSHYETDQSHHETSGQSHHETDQSHHETSGQSHHETNQSHHETDQSHHETQSRNVPGIIPPGDRGREVKSRARENSESATKTLSQSPEGECSHDQAVHIDAVTLDWQGSARALRPEVAAKPCWEKFRLYHQGKTFTVEEWDAQWRLWVLRERNNCSQNAMIAFSNRAGPGRLTAMLGPHAMDTTRYEVIES